MAQGSLPPRTVTLTALSSTITYQEMTPWDRTINIVLLRAILACAENSGFCESALAIQTATVDVEAANAPVVLGAYVNTQGRNLRNYDVTQAGNGDVNSHMFFRLLLAYRIKAGGGTLERGTFTLAPTWRT